MQLDDAEACFTRNGFHRTTMQDLPREAAMSPGHFYRYVESKEVLVPGQVERERAEPSSWPRWRAAATGAGR
jgi:TetR/AcrR family transcriptional regulator, repressor for uid operon